MIDFKTRSICGQLSEKFGGKWTYNSDAETWYCDDQDRYVRRLVIGQGETTLCMYFTNSDKPPNWIHL